MVKREVNREAGAALILMVVLGLGLMVLSAISLNVTLARSVTQQSQREDFNARQIAESAVAQAVAKIREGGMTNPKSGSGSSASWVSFGDGAFYYSTAHNSLTDVSTIRAWGRVAVTENPSSSQVAPDNVNWDGTGWLVRGIEVIIQGGVFVPEFPMYFGNGGVERPVGGFDWDGGSDPYDPSTWSFVASGEEASSQSSSVPFEVSALDHPIDYLTSLTAPLPTSTYPHDYQIWATQNPIGQHNISAWFQNSAGSSDATSTLTPPPTSTYFPMSDTTSQDHAYPVRTDIPDVQDFSWSLWNKYKDTTSGVNKLSSGSQSGQYGTLASPEVTFVTGNLRVDSGDTFSGSGILIVRDDFDPNTDTDNTPSTKASLDIAGTFEWTGLVIVAGWAPSINVQSTGDMTVVGSFFGEDSVQSGGEVSLDSATITLNINGPTRILYSNSLFASGGLLHDYLPTVQKEIIGYREVLVDGLYLDHIVP